MNQQIFKNRSTNHQKTIKHPSTSSKHRSQIDQKSTQHRSWTLLGPQLCFWSGRLDLRYDLGTLLGPSWSPLTPSWRPKWSQKRYQIDTKIDHKNRCLLKSIFEGFWSIFGKGGYKQILRVLSQALKSVRIPSFSRRKLTYV